MTESVVGEPAQVADIGTGLIGAAVELFTRHSFAGTSLQMIADELRFTKRLSITISGRVSNC